MPAMKRIQEEKNKEEKSHYWELKRGAAEKQLSEAESEIQ